MLIAARSHNLTALYGFLCYALVCVCMYVRDERVDLSAGMFVCMYLCLDCGNMCLAIFYVVFFGATNACKYLLARDFRAFMQIRLLFIGKFIVCHFN